MQIKRSGSQASTKGPADWFTGTVRIDPLFQPTPPARAVGASVTFEPGAAVMVAGKGTTDGGTSTVSTALLLITELTTLLTTTL